MKAPCFSPRWIIAGILISAVVTTIACQVPVFRYALERWNADLYVVSLTPAAADGELSAEEKEVAEFLESTFSDPEIMANVHVRINDQPREGEEPGTLRLFYPTKIRGIEVAPIWTGGVSMENARMIVDSPARREIVKRILEGQSAAWVMIRSGNPEKDSTAAKALTEALSEAGNQLEIPEGVVTQEVAAEGDFTGNPDNILRSDVPLKIDFSLFQMSRDDPAEQVFLKMFLNLEDDLGEYADEPMVFPVFGRGRVLEPLIGKGINADNALDYSGYLCGACSCEVKDQNPGMDLLVAANWDEALADSQNFVIDKVLPPLEGTAALISAQKGSGSQGALLKPHYPDKAPDAVVADVAPPSPNGAFGLSPFLILVGTAGFAVLFIAVGALIIKRKGS